MPLTNDIKTDNTELWISNWKRADLIDAVARQWLNSFEFEKVNIIANHSSVSIDNFQDDIKPYIKVWNNVMRHDDAIGPMVENYNQAYVHTFLSGKKYCICAHDNMIIQPGWVDIINSTDYIFYMAPQGDQVHIQTLDGLKFFGWWDERYATNGNHELDYATRALIKDYNADRGIQLATYTRSLGYRASIVDYHGWHGWPQIPSHNLSNLVCRKGHPEYGDGFPYLRWNDVGLDKFWIRADKHQVPQCGPKTKEFEKLTWNDKKWGGSPNTYDNFISGPKEEEVNWYPWLDLDTLNIDKCGII